MRKNLIFLNVLPILKCYAHIKERTCSNEYLLATSKIWCVWQLWLPLWVPKQSEECVRIPLNFNSFSFPTHICIYKQLSWATSVFSQLSPGLPAAVEKEKPHQLFTQPAEHIAWNIQEALLETFVCIKIITLRVPYKLAFLHKQWASSRKNPDSIW